MTKAVLSGRTSANACQLPTQRSRAATPVVLFVQLVLVANTTSVTVVLPQVAASFRLDGTTLSWVLNAYTLAFGGLLLTGGRLGDLFGRRRVVLAGLMAFALTSLVAGLAPSPALLFAARAGQGLSAALAAPGLLALLVGGISQEGARNRALGYFSAVSVGGGTVGILLGGAVGLLSWRAVLLLNVPFAAAAAVGIAAAVTETARQRGRFDAVGAAAATVLAVALVAALAEAASLGWDSVVVLALLATAAVGLVVLIVIERRVQAPVLPPRLLRNRQRTGALVVAALVFGAQTSMFFLLVQQLQGPFTLDPLQTGLAFLPLTALLILVAKFAPVLVHRLGQPAVLAIGTAGSAAAYALLALTLSHGAGLLTVLAPTLLLGAASGLSFMPATSLILRGVSADDTGIASGLAQTAQQLGGSIGLAVIVAVFSSFAPNGFTSGATAGFLAASGLTLVALLTVGATNLDWRRTLRARP